MKSIESPQDFNDVVKQDKPVLLDFYADWCGPCQTLLPIVEKLATEYSDRIEVRKINVDQNRELAAHFKVRSIPALFFLKNTKIVDQQAGLLPEFELRKRIDALLN